MGNERSKIYVQIFASGFIFEMMYIKKKSQIQEQISWLVSAGPSPMTAKGSVSEMKEGGRHQLFHWEGKFLVLGRKPWEGNAEA